MITNSAQNKLIYEFDASQNLNSTPEEVLGLDGDMWDYVIDSWTKGPAASVSQIEVRPNSDAGATKRDYRMEGAAAATAGSVNDSASAILLNQNPDPLPSYCRTVITGDSSRERYFDVFDSQGDTTKKIEKVSYYWKNTVDNLTSLLFRDVSNEVTDTVIRIYQVPKAANLANYDIVERVEFTSRDFSVSPHSFVTDGNSEEEYLLIWDTDYAFPYIRPNADAGNNYAQEALFNNNGTISAAGGAIDRIQLDSDYHILSIKSASGVKRAIKGSGTSLSDTSRRQYELGYLWNNTVDNITSIQVTAAASTATGSVTLYRRKATKTIDPVPMKTVVELDINADYSSGNTFSNIEGNAINGPIKVEFLGSSAGADELQIQLNGDAGSNYPRQALYGNGGSVTAVGLTEQNMPFGITIDSDPAQAVAWIWPKSGEARPVLSECESNESYVWKQGFWWSNTVDELTSMKIFTDTASVLTGTLKISIPQNSKQASPSWTVT